MQKGYIFQHRRSWYVRYYEPSPAGRKQCCKRLGSISDFPTRKQVSPLAAKILRPINENTVSAESAISVSGFIESVYLPNVKLNLRASTYKDYSKDVFTKHLKSRLGEIRMRDFRTMHGQQILDDIAAKNAGIVNHKTLQRIKSFLSGTFKHARRMGCLDSENPMKDTKCAGHAAKFKGDIYSVEEIEVMLISLPEPARTIVGLAALTGLRHSEIRGLRWSDYDSENGTLQVSRAVWRTHIQETKTESSEDYVPVLPLLQRALAAHKKRLPSAAEHDYIFAGSRKHRPLNLANLVRRVIVPAFSKSKFHPVWKGWHSFRRGLATNLYAMDVQPKVIAAILRHSDIGTTLGYYVKPPAEETRFAIEKMEEMFPFGL